MGNHIKFAEILVQLMDEKFSIGTFKFGLDPILNIIPWAGDVIGLLISFYIVWLGFRANLPQEKLSILLGNIALDFMIGIIPVVGIVADAAFRANRKNLKIIKDHLSTSDVVQEAEFVTS